MCRNKTVARILLIFSIANVVLAAPPLVQQRRFVKDRADDEPTDDSVQAPGLPAEPVYRDGVVPATPPSVGSPARSEQSLSDSMLDWLDGMLGEDTSPVLPLRPDYMLEPPSGVPESHDDLPLVSGGPGLHNDRFQWWLHTTERPPAKWEEGESSSRIDSGAPEMLPSTSRVQPLHDDTTPWSHDLNPVTDIEHHFHRSFKWSPKRDHVHRFSRAYVSALFPPSISKPRYKHSDL